MTESTRFTGSDPRFMRRKVGTLNDAWYIVARSRELGSKPLERVVMEQPLALFRDAEGVAAAVSDRCGHRNAKLSEGKVVGGCLTCPYHGWAYNGSGERVGVPSEGPEKPKRAGRPIESFPVVEQDGFVWVWMGSRSPREDELPYRFEPSGAEWESYLMVTLFDGDVTDIVENFMDVPHTAFVHAGWFRRTRTKPASALVERTKDRVKVTYDNPDDSIGAFDAMLNPDRLPMVHTDEFLSPNVTRVDYLWGSERGLVITSQITPITPEKAMVYTRIAFRFGRVLNRVARAVLPPYTRQVINQDVVIMRNQTENIGRYSGRSFQGTEADAIHRAIETIRDWRLNGEQGPPPGEQTTKIGFWM